MGADESFFNLGDTSLLVTLHEFLENHTGKVYCLLRGKKKLSSEKRLKIQLFYYFDKDYEELFGERLFILEGDVTRPDTLEQIKNLADAPTVINCAALVKHFSQGNEIEVVNYGGVKNLLEVCKAKKLRFIQISTISTVRSGVFGIVKENVTVDERTLYFRQSLTNKFQMNAGTNSAMGRLKIFAILGCCPFEQMDNFMEFSPIDEVAKTILLLSETPKECVIFHPVNHNNITLYNVLKAMTEKGLLIKFVEEEYLAAFNAAEEDPAKAKILTSML